MLKLKKFSISLVAALMAFSTAGTVAYAEEDVLDEEPVIVEEEEISAEEEVTDELSETAEEEEIVVEEVQPEAEVSEEAIVEEEPAVISEAAETADERDIDAEKAAFKAALEADGYAEMGSYKVEKMKDGVYHMDEETEAYPGGSTLAAYIDRETGEEKTGVMNNPSSMYFVVTDNEVVMIDGGDVLRSEEKYQSAKAIIEVMTDGKPLTFIITHGHSDHVRMVTTEGVLDDVDVKAVYVHEDDFNDDGCMVGSTTATPLPVTVSLDKVHEVKDGDVITVDGLDYSIMSIPAHTPGSLAIVQQDKELIFTGDSIGSGFVWAFWMYGDNPLGALQDGVKKLQNVVNSMDSAMVLAGHRWQQFASMFGINTGEIGIQYLNDMNALLNGLADGTTKKAEYTLRGNSADIELSATGSRARIDTQQEEIDAYLAALTKMDEAYIYSGSDKLSIESENATAAPVFVIYPDETLSDEEAQALLDASGITEIVDRSASKAYVMRNYSVDDFKTVVMTKIAVSENFKLIGIGKGATFINENLTQYMNFVSGLALIGGEAGNAPVSSVPTYISGANAYPAPYIAANSAEKTGAEGTFTTYVNPDSRFELVVVNSEDEDAVTGIQNAWDKVLNKFGRIGNYIDNSNGIGAIGTWYSRLLITGDDEADTTRKYQYFDSIEAIDNITRYVVTEDLDGDGQLNLWYEYIPEQAEDAEDGTVPVVLLMHGNTNDPRTQYDCSGWANIASEEGIILVAPEWQGHTYQGYTYQPMVMTTDDVDSADFIKMIKMIEEKYPQIDASRIYISGLSAGSRNTYMQGLANSKYIAAGAGQSGPFGVSGGATYSDVVKNKDMYDFPIIFFSGDADEYLMSTYDNTNISGAITTLQAFEALNNMTVTTADDLSLDYVDASGYPVAWDETYTIEATAENIATVKGGVKANAENVEISFNRIYGWGHWNYAPDARWMWDFMKKYARNLETGDSIRLDLEEDTRVTLTGSQRVNITGDDWGAGVDKTIVHLSKKINPESVDAADFAVSQSVNNGAVSERTVLDAYTSDADGNKVDVKSEYVTIEMRISPAEGSPIVWSMTSWTNSWADPYNLYVTLADGAELTADNGDRNVAVDRIKVNSLIDVDDTTGEEAIFAQLEGYEFSTFEASDGLVIPYGLYTPANADDGKEHALIIWNHGVGERGSDPRIAILGNEVTALNGEEFQKLFDGAYVLVPQTPSSTSGYDIVDGKIELVEAMVADESLNIDADRVIVGGCSMGGGQTMNMIYRRADLFAAAYPICPASTSSTVTDEQIINISSLPIWFTHCTNDNTVNYANTTEALIERLKAAGNENVHLSAFEDVHDTTGRFDDLNDGETYQYATHWSWVYFDNNECYCDECGLNEWEWLAKQNRANNYAEGVVKGLQKAVITGDDWGAGVNKVIIALDKEIDPASVAGNDFAVTQAVNGGEATARTVIDAYTSDAEGNEVAEASRYVTVEMRISPVEGSPIVWSMATWTNSWADPFELNVSMIEGRNITSGDEVIDTIIVLNPELDIDGDDALTPQLEGYEYGTYTASDGLVIPYGLYTPANADDGNEHALIIWNHGVGERGSDPRIAILGNEVTALNGEEFQALFDGAYVLVPQTPSSTAGYDIVAGKAEMIKDMVADENLNIDADRVIVGGCSMGGGQTMNLVYSYADLFAAAYPVCPASTSSTVADYKIENIANLPIWFTHCTNDNTVNYANTTAALVERLKAAGNENVHVSAFEDVHDTTGRFDDLNDGETYQYATHWSWVYFDNNECYCDECGLNEWEWLAQQNRQNNYKAGVRYAVNSDYPDTDARWQVTFTYVDDEAEEVVLTGAFQYWTMGDAAKYAEGDTDLTVKTPYEYKTGMYQTGYDPIKMGMVQIPMEEVADGVFQVVVPLHSGEYYYDYTVDGTTIQDPTNPSVANPANGHDSGHSLLWIGDSSDALKGQEYVFARTDEQTGESEFVAYEAVDGTTQYLTVYTPYGYDESNTYPVLYISHGGGGNEVEWHYIGATDNIFDNLTAEDLVEPTIVVSMDNTYFGWNMDTIKDNLMNYIIPAIEEKYSVSDDPQYRAFCGLSMGGLTTTSVYQTLAGEFGYLGIWSATQSNFEIEDVENAEYPTLMLAYGNMDFGRGGYAGLEAKLDAAGINYDEYVAYGAHDWGVWRELVTVFARDYLWEEDKNAEIPEPGVVIEENTDYPDSDADYQVTFTYKAPKGTQSVAIIGNFQFYYPEEVDAYVNGHKFVTYTPYEYEDGMYNTGYDVAAYNYMQLPMTKLNGTYYQITLPLPGNEYFYDFVVTDADGNTTTVKDPTNLPFENNGADSGHSLLYVGDKDHCIEGQEYIYPRTDGQEGTVEYVDYTDVNGDARTIGVYLPYGYDEFETYPTLYLCHGGGGNEVEWFNIGSAKNIYDNLIADGEVEPTIVVTMNNTVYNFERGASVQNILEVIVPLMEENYAVSVNAGDRAIAGLSSGASVTAQAALENNSEFAYYGIFSPSRTLNFIKKDGVNTVTDEQKAAFGSHGVYYVSVGEFDSFTRRTVNVDCYDELIEDGADAVFFWKPGAHDWAVWRNQLSEFTKDYLWKDHKEAEAGVEIDDNTDYPDSDADYQVTFTYEASSEDVESVLLVGDWTFYSKDQIEPFRAGNEVEPYSPYEYKEGMFNTGYKIGIKSAAYAPIEMDYIGDGKFQITLPLPGFEYFYGFAENGDLSHIVKDPTNLPVDNDGSDSGWSLLYVGDKDHTLEGQEYIYERDDDQVGTVEFGTYTAVDGSEQPFGIYLPYGYDENETYKVLYLSHGGGGNEVEWMYIGSAKNIFDNLIADGEVEPTIVVTMDNIPWGWDADKMNDNFQNYLIPAIEEQYSVEADKDGRAFAGLSMGGYTTVSELVRSADTYRYYGIFSANFRAVNTLQSATDEQLAALADNVYYQACGWVDNGNGSQDRVGTITFIDETLRQYSDNVTLEWKYGAHDWGVWRAMLTTFAKDYLWETPEAKAEAISLEDAVITVGETLPLELTIEPEGTNAGDIIWTSSDESIATVDENGNVFGMKVGYATITATTSYGLTAEAQIRVLFTDVPAEGKYYSDPVYWAVEKGITNGFTDADGLARRFGPADNCTRAQMVTFLWRLAGKSEPAANAKTFPDVSSDQYYYKAVLWAAGEGITKGYADGTFRPDDTCLREHAVTFLWRAMGKPAPTSTSNQFTDVTASDYYYNAVLWAAENNITKGYADDNYKTFRPKAECLREHIVTFMYRASN